jgi:hypothetical protein
MANEPLNNTEQLTPERLDEIEARANAATRGPWHKWGGVANNQPDNWFVKLADQWTVALVSGSETGRLDATFIAAARADVPALVAEVRKLQRALSDRDDAVNTLSDEVKRLEESLAHAQDEAGSLREFNVRRTEEGQ